MSYLMRNKQVSNANVSQLLHNYDKSVSPSVRHFCTYKHKSHLNCGFHVVRFRLRKSERELPNRYRVRQINSEDYAQEVKIKSLDVLSLNFT